MLGNFEKRHFSEGEKLWFGHYRNLTNVLHWHFESELICVTEGSAQVRIGQHCYEAKPGDTFFCAGEELHYIHGSPDSRIEVLILEQSITRGIADRFALCEPKLPVDISLIPYLENIRQAFIRKDIFYREALETSARALTLEIFRNYETKPRTSSSTLFNSLIRKINEDYAFITFAEACRWSGYSPAHFSKMFKAMSGMNFSDYLNIIRIEHAISKLRTNRTDGITAISSACGFGTIRNFNRVFRQLTGNSPRTLPDDFILDTGLHISGNPGFDPTNEKAILLSTK